MEDNIDLSIIFVTSPIMCHPSTELVEKVIQSFELVSGLEKCKLFLIADGVNVNLGNNYRPKRGIVPAKVAEAYQQYLDTLQQFISSAKEGDIWSRTNLIQMKERVGFGHAVLRGLNEASTEFVLVVQHDHPFVRRFDIRPVLDFMNAKKANYVNLPINTTFKHINKCWSEYQRDMRALGVKWGDGEFTPMMYWYDSTHVARRKTYLELVFTGDGQVPVGRFIEDTFSHQVLDRLKEDFDKWFPFYATYMYLPEKGKEIPLICHLDGRKYLTEEQRTKKGWGRNTVILGFTCEQCDYKASWSGDLKKHIDSVHRQTPF